MGWQHRRAAHPPPTTAQRERVGRVPVGQLVASHWQAPPRQRWPAEQAGPVPHLQEPPLQLSALAPQAAQVAPAEPQLATVGGLTQFSPLQQPVAQEVGEQLQLPFLHACPTAQAAPMPHLHEPPLQVSARVMSQAVQAAPPLPQLARLGVAQAPLLQHPLAQLAAVQPVQALLLQLWLEGQLWQARPPEPHAEVWLPVMQTFPAQQPLGQLEGLQTQAPPAHA